MSGKKSKLLDSFAIMRWTQQEKGWEIVKKLLEGAENSKEHLVMSQINVCEVYYKTIRIIGKEAAGHFLETFYLLPLKVIPPGDQIIWKAAEIKAEFPISLADCFAVATALHENATIVTGDPEFQQVQSLVEIDWI